MHSIDDDNAKEFYFKGNSTGILLIHGFTGTPSEMRYLGEYLKEKGFTVKGVLLKGHGTSPEDMKKTNHRDWIKSAVDGYKELKQECDEVFAVGLSMGGLLALYLARNFDVKGVASLSAPIRILNKQAYYAFVIKFFKKYVYKRSGSKRDPFIISYDRTPVRCIHCLFKLIRYVEENLPRIEKPVLILQSYKDGTVNPISADIIYRKIGSRDKSIIYLHESGHVITCDQEKDQVFEEVYNFINSKSEVGSNNETAVNSEKYERIITEVEE